MAERETTAPQPAPAELLRAALEKIVFFEWRVSELAGELSAVQSRCASAELERSRAEQQVQAALDQARAARLQLAELESERARLASLLAQPSRGIPDLGALEAEHRRAARLEAELEQARRELAQRSAERQRFLDEMIAQTRDRGEEPAALAQFISELRGEIIALRSQKEQSDALLQKAGLTPPASEAPPPVAMPRREPEPVRDARALWAQGRLAVPQQAAQFALPAEPKIGAAARALAEQCLRNLASGQSSRREQAARHLLASPLASAAAALATALGEEREPKARAQLARALAACGGEGAGDLLARLQASSEPALVRLAALDALATLPGRLRAALEVAAGDDSAAVRRRAAALAATGGQPDLSARLAVDEDASVRACADAARREPPQAPTRLREPEPAPALPAAGASSGDAAGIALQAVQAALFGLTESELAKHIGLPEPEAKALVVRLVEQGRLGRRGKRLVLAAGGAQ